MSRTGHRSPCPRTARSAAAFEVREDGTYRIDLASPAGTLVSASPQYAIDVMDDEAPVVSFTKPGPATCDATSIDEVFVEAEAERR